MTTTLTTNATRADVLLYTTTAPAQSTVSITRLNPDGTETILLVEHVMLCGENYFYDTTVPLDVAVSYRIHTLPDDVTTVVGPVTVPGQGFIWLGDPLRPWANLQLDLCAAGTPCGPDPVPCLSFMRWGTETRAVDANLIPILNRERPADIYARRKDVTVSTFRFLSRHGDDCACIEGIHALFTAGGPVHIRIPPEYCIPDRTYQPLDLDMAYLTGTIDQRKPWRMWDVPLIAVDTPPGVPQGVFDITWCDVNEDFATYADLTAGGFQWGSVVEGAATEVAPLMGFGGGGYGDGPYGD